MKMADAGFLLIEKPTSTAQVSMLTTWTLPPDAAPDFLAQMVARWRECRGFVAPFNLRLKPDTRLPDWEVLAPDQIDIDYHLRHSALPRPGGERELGVLASHLHSTALDRNRPLWEMHVIEGLENDRFAIFLKLHHSQIDGMGAIRMLERCLTPDAELRGMRPFWEVPARRATPIAVETAARRRPGLSDFGKLARAVRDLHFSRDPDSAAPFAAPMTVLNGRIGAPRRVATQMYDQARLKRLAKAAGVTMNDVALCISAGALRNYLLDRNELPPRPLTAGLPVSVRDDESMGNAIAFIIAKLHTGIADPLARLQAIHRSTTLAKDRLQGLPSRLTREIFGTLLMGPYMAQLALDRAGRGTPVYNVVISNVPGPKEFLYLDGARMEALHPISATLDGQALNITFMSYAGRCAVGFTACRESVPSMQRIAVATGDALLELEQALGVAADEPAAAPVTGQTTAGKGLRATVRKRQPA